MSLVQDERPPLPHPGLHKFLDEANQDPDILAIYQYGSSLTCSRYQDLDLCIIPYGKNSDKQVSSLFHYSGTYAGYGAIPLDITLFSLLPLYIRIEVIRNGKILFYKDRDLLFDLVLRTNRQWDDFEPLYRIMLS